MSGSPESAGNLTLGLGMPTGQLDSDVDRAQNILDRLAGRIGITAGIASAAGTLIGNFIGRGINLAFKEVTKAIKAIDDLNDASKRIGISVEHFSALDYIVKQTGTTAQAVETAFRNLNNVMDDTAAGKATAATRAFDALGIKVQDANGKLRDAHDVFLDVAEKFSKMEDGSKKAALAVDIFGKSGTQLIQTLDLGKKGIAALTKEAENANAVIGTDAANAVNDFNDQLDKLKSRLDGLWKMLAQAVIPELNNLYIVFNRTAMGLAGLAGEAIAFKNYLGNIFDKGLIGAAQEYNKEIADLHERFRKMAKEFETGLNPTVDPSNIKSEPAPDSGDSPKVKKIKAETKAKQDQITVEEVFLDTLKKQNDAEEYNNSIREIEQEQYDKLNESRYLTMEQFAQLNKLYDEGIIKTQQYDDAISGLGSTMDSSIEQAANKIMSNLKRIELFFKNVSNASASSWLSMADTMVDTLQLVFGESKELAIASAVINTAQAVMRTLAEYGGTPWGWAAAAAVAAMGAAQIAKIMSTDKGSSGGASAAPVSASGAGGGGAPAAGDNGTPQTLFVQGIDPNHLYTGEAVRNLAESLLQYQRDGGRVVLQGA